ncbi:MAG: ABC transporter permease [Myxococcales bacterium]|nr:ABC transporter permease [Myxococcales bacterium]TDI94988.1 MAG: ABC transporter permease [Deltaproteobacteria bacterium]TDJ09903.1 MAG: ABC transporter permease [Deltaproteobacteria bacterium]
MIRYALWRILQGIPVLLIVASITFALLRFLPGGPFEREKALPPEILRNIEARYHLDEPLGRQYLRYLADLARGDLGPSYKYVGRDVTQILGEALPVSLQLGAVAFVLCCVFGMAMGLLAAVWRGSAADRGIMLLALLGVSVPSFVLAALLVLGVGLGLGWLPAALWEGPRYAVLPAITLAALPTAYVAQLTRTSVIEVIDLDYVRTARAKGLSELHVHLRHVLRNALLAVVTYFGPLLAMLLTGSFVVEHIFAIPGIGRFFVTAVTNRDYPLVMGVTLLYAVLVVAANLAVDLLYGWLDPRIRLGGREA